MGQKFKKIDIIGTVGVPGNYGGFETLAENLVRFHFENALPEKLTVYCSSKGYAEKQESYLSARLKYLPLNANGFQSIPYDMLSLLSSILRGSDVILLLGVSGAMILPVIRLVSKARIVTNIDGIEWKRQKWKGISRWALRFLEDLAVRFSHVVVADNEAIAEYVHQTYGISSNTIAYGGDHAVACEALTVDEVCLPEKYAFSVCRIEPENNVRMIVDAFSKQDVLSLVVVGNWNNSDYGRDIRRQYGGIPHIYLLDPIYSLGKLKTLRTRSNYYVHGHSAGGTNPSLVEAMHFGKPILAFDCIFNRFTTEEKAFFFSNSEELKMLVQETANSQKSDAGQIMREVAERRYTWDVVAKAYFSLM